MDSHSIAARPSATTENNATNLSDDRRCTYAATVSIRTGKPTEAEGKTILPGAETCCDGQPPRIATSRRLLLAGFAALPLAACPAPVPARPAGVCAKLAGLIAGYIATETEYDRFCVEVYNPAVDRQDALIANIPHFEIDATLAADGSRMWSTREGNGSEARGIASIARSYQNDSSQWQDKMRRARTFTAADLRRKRAIERTHQAAGLDAVDAQEDEICARLEGTRQAIRDYPASTPSDLKVKLETLDQWLTHAEMKDMVMSDLDSIQSREA